MDEPQRDPRWEKVDAKNGEPEYNIDFNWPPQTEDEDEKTVEFLVSVRHKGIQFWHRHWATKGMIKEYPELEKMAFERSIEKLDEAMDEYDRTGTLSEY